jgi:hypothetical protein
MPLLRGNGIGLALPRSTLLFFDVSWSTHSGGFWGWCLTPTGIQCMETHNTTINRHRRVVSITGGRECCLFLTKKPDFHHFWVGETGHDMTLDCTPTVDTTIYSNEEGWSTRRKCIERGLPILCGLKVNVQSTINHVTWEMGYDLRRTAKHAVGHIWHTKTNLAKPSPTQQLTTIWKGSASLDLVQMDVYWLQGWFWWLQGGILSVASYLL